MTLPLLLVAALAGYLAGSVSAARLIAGRTIPGEDLSTTAYPVDERGSVLVSRGVSASAVRARAGARWGAATAVLDILKAFIPTLGFAVAFPGEPAAVVAATAAVLGHVWPLYHRFQGGFGQSPIIGGLLALDPLGLLASMASMLGIGALVADSLVAFEAWPIALLPWALWRGDEWLLAYAVVVNAVYWHRMLPEVRQRIALYRTRPRGWRERWRELLHEFR